ncbi:MAG: glycosyltransferase family 2 protein, partial [Acidimicrobiia bacterium]
MSYDVVVPTVGRPSLAVLLDALGSGRGPAPERVIVVDDRRHPTSPLPVGDAGPAGVVVVPGRGRGPAAARNAGWRAGTAEWAAFLDDDVVPPPDWRARLAADLAGQPPGVGASQGRLEVPLPAGRRPTDWERNVAGLEAARWATADMAYRRAALAAVGGFDERFPRAFREDADLAVRVAAAGWRLVVGDRRCVHPVRPADRWVSVRLQAGNADDVLMRALHGRRWREAAGVPPGRRRRHLAVTASAAAGLAGALARRPG